MKRARSHGERVWWRNRAGRRGRCLVRFAVDEILQFLAGLEVRNLLRRNVDLVTGLGVAALAGLALAKAEAAKTAEFDLLPAMQRVDDALEHRVDDDFGVFLRKVRYPRDFLDEFG